MFMLTSKWSQVYVIIIFCEFLQQFSKKEKKIIDNYKSEGEDIWCKNN